MREFQGKVAVVTGAASGIGRALADRCASEGMKVVLADVDEQALAAAQDELRAAGADVRAVRTDVSRAEDVEALARQTLDAFGAVHLLCNNAGVGGGSSAWESTLADWKWVLGVNLWGVIHGVHTFVPLMLQQDTEGHIVNTASMAGLISGPGLAVYKVSKFGVVTLSETLYHELGLRGAKIKVSVLCPGWVRTRITDAERNRPAELRNDAGPAPQDPAYAAVEQWVRHAVETGMPPSEIADQVFQAIRDERFYILTHPEMAPAIRARAEDVLQQRNPKLGALF
jgi:NAD(P)-dependent dehydrogenase (short-subunit alcohol dehydrogenase family)